MADVETIFYHRGKAMIHGVKKKKVLLASPLPPPHSGWERITEYILNSGLTKKFQIIHLDTSNKRMSNSERGRFDLLNIIMSLKSIFKLVILMCIYRPDISEIPLPQNRAGFLKWSCYILIASLFRSKIVSRLEGAEFDRFHKASSPLMKKYIQFILNRIDLMIVRANTLKHQLNGLIPFHKIKTIYHPISHETSQFSTRHHVQSSNTYPNILFLSHISKAKGALDLLKSIPFVIKEIPHINFLFTGDIIENEKNIMHINNPSSTRAEIETIIRSLKINDYVKFLGVVTGQRKRELLSMSTLLVLPSYSEAFSYVILEAMASGLPIITTPVGAFPEVFRQNVNVRYTEVGHPRHLAENILDLIRNPDLRLKMKHANYKLIQNSFTMAAFEDRMTEIFTGL